MSTQNFMTLKNKATGITLHNYNLIHTNSVKDIAVLAGLTLEPNEQTSLEFEIKKGKDDTFIFVFNDPDQKNGWQGTINTGHDLSSKEKHMVTVVVENSGLNLTMALFKNDDPTPSKITLISFKLSTGVTPTTKGVPNR
jgi:hypothetical protein